MKRDMIPVDEHTDYSRFEDYAMVTLLFLDADGENQAYKIEEALSVRDALEQCMNDHLNPVCKRNEQGIITDIYTCNHENEVVGELHFLWAMIEPYED